MQVSADDLAPFPGGPFVDEHVEAVVAKLNRALGWHVAPVRSETLTVRTAGGDMLLLPSRKVVEVTEVRRGETVIPSSAWKLTTPEEAMLRGHWFDGEYEVDVVHGYPAPPADLLAEVARACVWFRTDPLLASWSSGPMSASLRSPGEAKPSSTFFAYSVHTGV